MGSNWLGTWEESREGKVVLGASSGGLEGWGLSRTRMPSSLPAVFRECLGNPRRDGNSGDIYQNSESAPWPKDQ